MTENQIIILCFVGFWMLVGILTYILLLKGTRKEYKKFYPHPIVNVVKDINSDDKFNFWEKLFIFTCLNIVYLPIICEWLVAWCLYKSWKFICIDDAAEQKIEEEIKEQPINNAKEEKVEQDKVILHNEHMMEKDLENTEYMSKDYRSDDYLRSQEIDLSQTSDDKINKVEDVENTSTIMNNEDKPKVEQEVKPKRKYNKKKNVENSDGNNETKNN